MAIARKILIFICFWFPVMAFSQVLGKPVTAPDFVLQNQHGKAVKLSNFRGKTILLDFWASWCFPCRIVNRKLVKAYPELKEKNFEIVSVSVDEDLKKWHRAIKKDKMPWPQLIDAGNITQSVAHQWQIRTIPANYLINPEGKIMAINIGIEDLINLLKE